MCELLVRVRSKVNPTDPYLDVQLTKRGDVIVVAPDGHAWGRMELTLPEYRIFRWPSLSESAASVFVSPEISTSPQLLPGVSDPMLQRRGFSLDVDLPSLPAALRKFLADDSRAQPYFNVPDSIKVSTLKKQKKARSDPATFG